MYFLYYAGEKIEYEIQRAVIKNIYIQIKEKKVIVKIPKEVEDAQVTELVERKASWIYKNLQKDKQKKEEITQEKIEYLEQQIQQALEKYTKQTGFYPNKCRIRDIKYAWGTCSSNKNITINLKLATKTSKEIEYVVLHELCHIGMPNHSKQFWDLMERYMPDYKEIRKKLKS